ncbi:hypothetical protein [Pedobacter namyangjuensis]|uniref:hypothetical protein n=1 Tax=Pedobacter namyangjuensis TaxID=600626 RepID=UPI000DE336FA|nr:hypothetical protein [Pedobacter namyangjuensis]
MKRFRLIFLSYLLLQASQIFAQQEFILNGVVMENGSKMRVALAEITNKRNKYSTGSNDMGIFQLKSAVGDTILITKRGFNDKEYIITSTKDALILINRGTTLNEVVITGQSKKQTLDAVKQDFRDKGSFYAGKPKPLAFIFTPLTALYELFGRTPKNARRFSNMYNTEMEQTHIDGFFNKSIIGKNTGLTGKELEHFMINYRPEYEKTKNWNVYDGTKYIRDSYKNYTDTLKKN